MRRETKESKVTGGRIQTRFNAGAMRPTEHEAAQRSVKPMWRQGAPLRICGGISSPLPKRCDISFGKRAIHESPAAQFLSMRTGGFRAALRFYHEPFEGLSLQGCVKFLRTRATKKNGYRIRPSCRDKIKNFLFVESPLTRYAGALPRGEP